jgi:hypothetical protein
VAAALLEQFFHGFYAGGKVGEDLGRFLLPELERSRHSMHVPSSRRFLQAVFAVFAQHQPHHALNAEHDDPASFGVTRPDLRSRAHGFLF